VQHFVDFFERQIPSPHVAGFIGQFVERVARHDAEARVVADTAQNVECLQHHS